MIKVAITGNIASGKSVLEQILKEKGFAVIDADEIAHNLIKNEAVKTKIIQIFQGFDIVENGEISRKKLGQIVFVRDNLRKKLEEILHPAIKDEIGRFFRQQQEQGEKIAFASVPLLFEAKFEDLFDKIIFVYADDEIRLKRLMQRNNLALEHAQNRLSIQISQDKKAPLADYVIYNNSDLEYLKLSLEKILKELL